MILEERIAAALVGHGAESKRMFGGTCFLINGNMLMGTLRDGLLVRVGKESHKAALELPGASAFVMNGKLMQGFVTIRAVELVNDADLLRWLNLALAFNRTLPKKEKRAAKTAKRR